MKKFLAVLFISMVFCFTALAESSLEAPYAPDSPRAVVAEAAAKALGTDLQLTSGGNTVAAVDVMLQTPGVLLCTDQSVLFSSLQGYTSQDLRTDMQPICRIAVSPLFLVVNKQNALDLGISSADALLSYIRDHEYEFYFARHLDADVIDRAVVRLSESLPVFTDCYTEEEIPAALEKGDVLAAVVSGEELTKADQSLLPLCSLSVARTELFPDLPCAAELGLPVCDGITVYLFTSSDTDNAIIESASSACMEMLPASVPITTGFTLALLSGEAVKEEIRDLIADYIDYMTSEGLFFYEE